MKKKETFYTILNTTPGLSDEDYENAFKNAIVSNSIRFNKGEIDADEYKENAQLINNAYKAIGTEEEREAYEETLHAPNPKKRRGIAAAIAAGALAATLTISMVSCSLSKNNDKGKTGASTPTVGTLDLVDEKETKPTTATSETKAADAEVKSEAASAKDSTIPEVKNYGDINDPKLVTERATKLKDELDRNNLLNLMTMEPYSVADLENIIRYYNGAYVPNNEDEIYDMVDNSLNFTTAPLNSENFIAVVNYNGGEESFKPVLESMVGKYDKGKEDSLRINFVDNILFGDATIKPYLTWLEDKYYFLLTTTDHDAYVKAYNEVMQSLADFSFGEGFKLDGKVYKERYVLRVDRVAESNLVQFLVFIFGPFRTYDCANAFIINDPALALEDNEVPVPYLQVVEWFNPLCDDEWEKDIRDDEGNLLIDQEAYVDEEGNVIIPEDPQHGRNFGSITQMNTVSKLYGNFETKSNPKALTK